MHRSLSVFGNTFKLLRLAAVMVTITHSLHAADERWITTWGCAPQLVEPGNLPPVSLAGRMLRQFVHTTKGGEKIRVRLSNQLGKEPVTVEAARVALAAGTGSAGTGDIDPTSDKGLTFSGKSEVVIPPGVSILSDALDFKLPALTNVAISLNFGDISATTVNGHPGSRTTSFIDAHDTISAATLPAAAKTQHWYIATGIEVEAAKTNARTIVVLGDSITDGRGSTTDGNDRWPDALATRLQTNTATANVGVVNMGIGGNAIFGGLGPAAEKRFERDVLDQAGGGYFILFEGVNDIGTARDGQVDGLPERLIEAYTTFAKKAHSRGLKAYAATITPFGKHSYFTPEREECRQKVNAWIRDNKQFDGFVDFDAIVRDPANPANVLDAYSSDGLHLNPAGYQIMADSIDLDLFAP